MATWNDVTHADGLDNPGGISMQPDAILFAANEDVATAPDLPATPTTDSTYVTVADSFTMVTDKVFHKIYCTPETGMIESSMIGETDGKSFKHEFSFFIPGSGDDAEAFGRKLLNSRGYFVVVELDGTIRLMGTKKFPAFTEEGKATSGGKVADRRGTLYKVYCYGTTPQAPKFSGTAPVE